MNEHDFHKIMKLPIYESLRQKDVQKLKMTIKIDSFSKECYNINSKILKIFKTKSNVEQWWHPHYYFIENEDYFMNWKIK